MLVDFLFLLDQGDTCNIFFSLTVSQAFDFDFFAVAIKEYYFLRYDVL
jgi:hypothetical protein